MQHICACYVPEMGSGSPGILLAGMAVLGTEPGSSARTARALNPCTISASWLIFSPCFKTISFCNDLNVFFFCLKTTY